MKRSEAIKRLDQAIMRYHHEQKTVHKLSEIVLQVVEDIGMLPPLTELGKELACTSDHDNRDIGKAYAYFKWEPEDENITE